MGDSRAVILGSARTPIGKMGGALSGVPATELGAAAIQAAIGRASIEPGDVDYTIMGNVLSAGLGQAPARQAAIGAGIPEGSSALTVNKVCASGMMAVVLAQMMVQSGDADIVVAGGMENMSRAPHMLEGSRSGRRLGDWKMADSMIHDGLTCSFSDTHMGTLDEAPRPDTSMDRLAGLPAPFYPHTSVTSGNSSQISDGAAALVIAREEAARSMGLEPVAAIEDHKFVANEPARLFEAPAAAIRELLQRAAMSIDDVDLLEVNEAFSAQVVANGKALDWDWDRVNVNGGAVALGHPIGASGARILVTLLHALERRGMGSGIAAVCHGGGGAVGMRLSRN